MLQITKLTLSLLLITGCSSFQAKQTASPKEAFELAKKYEEDKLYNEAILKYEEVQNKHLYSEYAILAKLRIADIHYKRKNWIEAQMAYQIFQGLHPQQKPDYVRFRIGMSYAKQIPKAIDRDLSEAPSALKHFNHVIKKYPQSLHVDQAKKQIKQIRLQLAEKEIYVADFYFKGNRFKSALMRYENVIHSYKDTHFFQRALYGAGISSLKTNNEKSGKKYLEQLISLDEKSELALKSKRAMSDHETH